MTTLTHKSPLGKLEIPGVLGLKDPGEPFDLPIDAAVRLLDQADLYEVPGGIGKLGAEELKALAGHRGIDIGTATTKKDILAALAAADAEEADE